MTSAVAAGARPQRRIVPPLQLLAAAALFSTAGAGIKAVTFDGWQVAGFRALVAALTVLALVPGSRRGWNARVLLVGVAYAATMILFVLANKLTTAANTIFLQSTAPLYILLLAPWLLGEKIRGRDVAFMLVVAAGLGLFFLGDQTASATAPDPTRGNALAAVNGIAWAVTVMGMRSLASGGGSAGDEAASRAVAAGNLLTFLACLPMALPIPLPGRGTAFDWTMILYLGVFQIGIAYVFLTRAFRHVPALEASLILLVEPALNPLWAWAVHDERPSHWALAGGGVILSATLARTWIDARTGPAEAVSGG